MTQATVGEIKHFTATIASGAPTSSAFFLGGYRAFGLLIPVLTSAAVAWIGENTAGSWTLFRNTAGAQYSAATPGGTGGMLLGAEGLEFLKGYMGQVRVSANANQAADRDFVWYLKG